MFIRGRRIFLYEDRAQRARPARTVGGLAAEARGPLPPQPMACRPWSGEEGRWLCLRSPCSAIRASTSDCLGEDMVLGSNSMGGKGSPKWWVNDAWVR